MRPGEVVADRFELEAFAGAGGMGKVYRGRDLRTGEPVAVKMLHSEPGSRSERFAREARILARLSHPHVVRHVAHGTAADGRPFLAMEWLDGQDLASRLARGPLTVAEAVEVARQVAEALAAAHACGVVHRDLKPSNIFLVGGRLGAIKLLDFGIARLLDAGRLTRTGTLVGTLGYVAPEQVRDEGAVDGRTDVFALGCVLFECLTGQPAFAAEHPLALLAKVVFAEPPRLRELRSDAPEAVEQLVLRMLAKEPGARPGDGRAALDVLTSLDARATASAAPLALTRDERRTVSVVLLARRSPVAARDQPAASRTLEQAEADAAAELQRCAGAWGARLWRLCDGSVAVTLEGVGLATDQAATAARCALALQALDGERAVALATGRGDGSGRRGTDETIDRAAALLVASSAGVAIDEMTARLIDGRFDVREGADGLQLHGEREAFEGSRLLLGKLTPCVGRDRELANLAQLAAECVEEPRAQAALITGPAGAGKSRVAQEFLARLRQGGAPFAVWFARGDVLRAGSALSLLAQATRGACGVRGDEDPVERRERLLAHVARHVAGSEQRRVAEFLGEMIGTPFLDDDRVLLRTARRSPQIMTDEISRAWIDYLRAVTRTQPVVLVLEDLHWGDGSTVRFVDAALRELHDRPWMVVALARPEVHELFSRPWSERSVQEIPLRPLGRKASERLVRHVLGAEVGPETHERIIDQADGNAFYLEELIRASSQREHAALPATVIAMVQSRLAGLDDDDRQVLRAAAVFGEVVWPGGVAALLADRGLQVRRRLLSLVEREVLVARAHSRFADEIELAFRHVLLREGAYAMLTDDDRVVGHALAGEWLERVGESDAKLLAEHFERGRQGERAAAHFLRAASQALGGGDAAAALRFAERGLAGARDREQVATLRNLEAEAKLWSGDLAGSYAAAREALALARPGSRDEALALATAGMAACFTRDTGLLRTFDDRLLDADPDPTLIPLYASAIFAVITVKLFAAEHERARLYLRRLEHLTAAEDDPLAASYVEMSRSIVACHADSDLYGMTVHARRAIAHFERSGVGRFFPLGHHFLVSGLGLCGQFEAAEAVRATVLAASPTSRELLHLHNITAHILLDRDQFDEALAVAGEAARRAESMGDPLLRLTSRLCLLEALIRTGRLDAAEAEAGAMHDGAVAEPYVGGWFIVLLARLHLARGRLHAARERAEQGHVAARAGRTPYMFRRAMVFLTRAEVLHALGEFDGARAAIGEARDDLLRRAAAIPDLDARRDFLERLTDHRRTLALARDWLEGRS